MNLAELQCGEYRIYAAALDAPGNGGFYAGVVVRQAPVRQVSVAGDHEGRTEAFRDERLDDGQVWASPDEALAFALQVGRAAIYAQRVVRLKLHSPVQAC